MQGAAEALTAGRAWPQGVVSNKSGKFLRAEVAHLGWEAYFGAVIGAGDAAADKPDPAPIHLALGRLGATADLTAVLIGDASHDLGVDRAAPDLHFRSAHALAARLGSLAMG